uniref:Uncharacterized protein n=2 Tax=Caenorhabditis japonica TaxID=281687 RepID=A0A8R1EI45_CAEJA
MRAGSSTKHFNIIVLAIRKESRMSSRFRWITSRHILNCVLKYEKNWYEYYHFEDNVVNTGEVPINRNEQLEKSAIALNEEVERVINESRQFTNFELREMALAINREQDLIGTHYAKYAKLRPPALSIDGVCIPSTCLIRDLGVLYSSNLSFATHIDKITGNAHRRVNILFNLLRHSSRDIIIKCYKIYVRPLLEYASIIFNPVQKELIRRLESVQKSTIYRCYRKFGIEYISYFDCLQELELQSLEYRRLIIDLVFIYKSIVTKEVAAMKNLSCELANLTNLRRHKYYTGEPRAGPRRL